jgi:surface antigen
VKTLVTACTLMVATAPLWAAGENAAFKDTPVVKFEAEDYALMRTTVRQALAAEPGNNQTLSWKNEASGASGRATPVESETWQNLPCRQVRIANTYRRQNAEGVYRFCQRPPGTWKLVGPVAGKR